MKWEGAVACNVVNEVSCQREKEHAAVLCALHLMLTLLPVVMSWLIRKENQTVGWGEACTCTLPWEILASVGKPCMCDVYQLSIDWL